MLDIVGGADVPAPMLRQGSAVRAGPGPDRSHVALYRGGTTPDTPGAVYACGAGFVRFDHLVDDLACERHGTSTPAERASYASTVLTLPGGVGRLCVYACGAGFVRFDWPMALNK